MTTRRFSGICRPCANPARLSLRTATDLQTQTKGRKRATGPAFAAIAEIPERARGPPAVARTVPPCLPIAPSQRWTPQFDDTGLFRRRRAALIVEPRLRGLKPGPAWQCGANVDLAPFHVAWRLLEFGDFWKERFYKPLYTPIAIRVGLRPIIGDQDRADRNRIHGLTGSNEVGIIIMVERRRR